MLQRAPSTPHLHVLVATPSGVTGQGGIDRIMSSLRAELEARDGDDLVVRFAATRGVGPVVLSAFYVAGFCLRMAAARLTGRLDVVHINLSSYGSTYRKLIISAWARALGIPYVLHLHGAEFHDFWASRRPLGSRRIRAMFESAAAVVVLGRIWRDRIAALAPAAAGRIVIVPNATAAAAEPHRGGGNIVHILFLGRLGGRKGVPQLEAALHRMKGLAGWRATLAGDGEIEAARHQVGELGLADRVALPGWVGAETVTALLAEADILVLPSFAENLPISVIEGMAHGLAVVATPVGAVEEIITDEVTGLLVAPGDVDALSGALTRLVTDPALRVRLGAAAQAVHHQRLELAPFADALGAVWKDAAARPKGTRR